MSSQIQAGRDIRWDMALQGLPIAKIVADESATLFSTQSAQTVGDAHHRGASKMCKTDFVYGQALAFVKASVSRKRASAASAAAVVSQASTSTLVRSLHLV